MSKILIDANALEKEMVQYVADGCADSGTVVSEDDTCPYWHGKEGGAE